MRQIRAMILAAFFAALTAIGAFLRILTPVSSFTLQVLFTSMAGVLLFLPWDLLKTILCTRIHPPISRIL